MPNDLENTQSSKSSVPGRFLVNDYCLLHGLCESFAPNLFAEDEQTGVFYVKKQPETAEEFELMRKSIENCPMGAIRDRDSKSK
ncbi:MAG: ferredoxin [Verrucomicrobiales bacterium]|jgi:ferredoxin